MSHFSERLIACLPAVVLAAVLLFGGGILTAFLTAFIGAVVMGALMTVAGALHSRGGERQ